MAWRKTRWLFIALTIVAVIFTLFVPPFFGKSDDGSFFGVLEGNGMYSPDGQAGAFNSLYGVTGAGEAGHAVISLAKLIGTNGGVMDIRWLGLIYSLIFVTGVALSISAAENMGKWARLTAAVLLVLMFSDIGYVSYFNSFYTDALPIAASLLMFGSLAYTVSRDKKSFAGTILFAAGIIMMFYAGGINRVIALLACVVLIRLLISKGSTIYRAVTATLLAACVAFGAFGYTAPQYSNKKIDLYNSVFYGMIYESPTAEEDLAFLSVPAEYAILAGVDYYEAEKTYDIGGERFQKEFYDNVSYGKIVKFYITHPARLYKNLDKATQNMSYIRQGYISNKSADYAAYRYKPEMAVWSNLRRIILPTFFVLLLVIFVLVAVFAARGLKKEKATFSDVALLALAGAVAKFVQPVIVCGMASISKNLAGFNVLFDLVLVMSAAWCVEVMMKRREKLRSMYGVTQ